jgi:hypothetical protein
MALTLTTELSTEKDKQGHKPVFLFNFKDLSILVGSRNYTLNGSAYLDFIRFGSIGSISQSIPQMLNRISSVSTIVFSQPDYRGNLRNAYLGSGTDLTDSSVEIGLKFDTGLTNPADNLILFDGFVGSYNESQDIFKMNLETRHYKNLPQLPQTLIIDAQPGADLKNKNICVPLQYGDFSSAIDFTFFGDFNTLGNGLAIIPYNRSDPSTSSGTDGDKLFFSISGHLMNQVPADNFGVSNIPDAFYFFRRKGRWIHLNADNTTTTNTAGGSELSINRLNGDTVQDNSATLILWGGSGYSGGADALAGNIDLALDGLSSTSAFADSGFGTAVKVHNFNISGFTNSDQKSNQPDAYFYMTARTADGTATIRKKSDDTVHGTQVTINAGTALNTWVKIPMSAPDTIPFEDLNDYYITIETTTAGRIEIAGLIFAMDLQPYDPGSDEQTLYCKCIGREFESTFDGRYTQGNAITTPSTFIESLFRDEFGFTAINTDSFDRWETTSKFEIISVSLFKQQSGESILSDISQAFNVGITITPNGEALVVNNDSAQVFSDSGTSTPGNEDIFTDSATITSNSFDQHPIMKGTFLKSRSDPRSIIKRRSMNYGRLFDSSYLFTQFDGTGDVSGANNNYLANAIAAGLTNVRILNWLNSQKWILSFTTYFNGISLQLGDIKNIRHGDLDDIILDNPVNDQKWALINYGFDWGGRMKLSFIEL